MNRPFIHIPELVTPRLFLRQVQPEDDNALFAIKSNPIVTGCFGREPHFTIDDTRQWNEPPGSGFQRLMRTLYFFLWLSESQLDKQPGGYQQHP